MTEPGARIGSPSHVPACDWRRRMSNHVACALLAYTALQIFLTMHALEAQHGSLLPYVALVVMVAAMIPVCRSCEGRWRALDDSAARDPAMVRPFHRDCRLLWALALGVPVGLTLLLRGLSLAFG